MNAEPVPRPGSLISRLRLVQDEEPAEVTAGVTSRVTAKSAAKRTAKSAARRGVEPDEEDPLSWLAPPDENGFRHLTKEQVDDLLRSVREAKRSASRSPREIPG